MKPNRILRKAVLAWVAGTGGVWAFAPPVVNVPDPLSRGEYEIIAQNDLGMHCMNEDFSELVILPPYNTVRAQVIQRRREPDIVTDGLTLRYGFPSNTRSADKTNFWKYCPQIFGVTLPPNVGLTGHGMTGTLDALPREGVWEVSGIPITPFDDRGRLQPYPLITIIALKDGAEIARTQTVVPVSQEITCNLCHVTPGVSTATDILRDHDRLHGTTLEQSKPVLCAACHADPALGAEGNPELPMLSHAMHGAHAARMDQSGLDNVCYACHPGIRTQCQRDVHMAGEVECIDCHGDMAEVARPSRMPWLQEPSCGSCHARTGFEFEEPGKLFRHSRGHGGVACLTCHGSPHAITPTLTAVDNAQSMRVQGRPGTINDCLVCHTRQPEDNFRHRLFN